MDTTWTSFSESDVDVGLLSSLTYCHDEEASPRLLVHLTLHNHISQSPSHFHCLVGRSYSVLFPLFV